MSSAAAFMAFGSARTVPALAVAALAAGISFDAYRPAAQAMMTDTVPADDRPRALSSLYLALNVGRGIACVAGGLMAEHAFWPLFALNAVINLAFGLTIWLTTRDNDSWGAAASAKPRATPRAVVLRDRHLLAFTAITMAFYLIHMQSVVTLPMIIDRAGASPLAFGLLLALDPLAVAVLQMLLANWLDRISALVSCAVGVVLVGVGLAVTGMGSTVTWFALTIPIWVAGEVCFLAVAPGVIAAIAPPDRRGTYFGIWGCTQGVAAIAAPPVAAVLLAVGGTTTLWLAGAIAGVFTAAACLALGTRLRARPVSM
jgi:sugar phosphate permease